MNERKLKLSLLCQGTKGLILYQNFPIIFLIFPFFFLKLISDYCKNFHQSKPFSHIVMDLFKRVIVDPNYNHQKDPPKNEKQESNIRIKMNLKKHLVEDHK